METQRCGYYRTRIRMLNGMDDTSEDWNPEADTQPGWVPKTPKEERGALDRAPLATLRATPTTVQARHLMGDLAHRYPRPQSAKGKSYARKKTLVDHAHAMGAFVADLLAAIDTGRSEGWLRCSLRKTDYTGKAVKWTMFDNVRTAFTEAKLVDHKPGYPPSYSGLRNPGPRIGKLTRYRATPALLELCAAHGVTPASVHEHFEFVPEMPSELVRLTKPYVKTPETTYAGRLRGQVAELNAFAAQQMLAHPQIKLRHLGWVRMFHRADHPDFHWSKGGRLYSQPQNKKTCYQLIGSKQRKKISINEESVVEIDISSAYLTVFYSWCGQQLDTEVDAYGGILGDTALDREVAKCWINMSFGAEQLREKWTKKIKDYLLDRLERKDIPSAAFNVKSYPMRWIRERVLQRHPMLERWGTEINGRVRDWSDLMFTESEAIIGTMRRLMAKGIASYPVHDSLIVQRRNEDMAVKFLKEEFKAITGVVPKLETKRPEPIDF